jgi:hypothetical protein
MYRQPFRGEYGISQQYGEIIPGVTYKNRPHTGIDYLCPFGTEILASGDGIVMFAGWDRTGFGNLIILQHPDRKATVYAHLNTIRVRIGDQVQQGDVIGTSGTTGNSTGPHLHFEARSVWWNADEHKDPVTYLPLQTVDDALISGQVTEIRPAEEPVHKIIPEGKCRVACEYAYIRIWPGLIRDRLINRGERVYVYEDVKYSESGLPFRFIGAGRCIAEYDIDGTQILETEEEDGSEEG